MYSPSIQKLIDLFSKFPTVGPRTASRFVFYLRKLSQKEIDELLESIKGLRESVKACSFCFNPFEIKPGNKENLCPICQDPSRDRTLLCVVEKESDLVSLENTKNYKGLYFILGGYLPLLKKQGKEKIRIKELKERILHPEKFGVLGTKFQEIILALNPTTEGKATTLYLKRFLKPLNKKVTCLGLGLPTGGELEYADEETLKSALESRK